MASRTVPTPKRLPARTPIRRPSALLTLTELPRALIERSTLTRSAAVLATAPRGDGHPVMVLPGFATGDGSTAVLRRYLTELGYQALAWELGRNYGPKAIGTEGEILLARLQAICDATGQKVSLVGWSLGGIMARLGATRAPELVRQVITLGSPFAGDPKATTVWRAYEWMSGHKIDDAHTQAQLCEISAAPQVPCTAIYSREDGIVAWQNCVEASTDRTDNIQVHGSHCGLGVNPAVLYAVADRLSQDQNDWQPFRRHGLMALLYPTQG